MTKKALLTFIYGILIVAGGIIGYTKSGSFPSLFMGVGLGILLIISAIGTFKDSILAFFASIILSALLSFFFLWRFMKTQSFAPAGILAIISILVFITLIALPNKKKS